MLVTLMSMWSDKHHGKWSVLKEKLITNIESLQQFFSFLEKLCNLWANRNNASLGFWLYNSEASTVHLLDCKECMHVFLKLLN